MIVPVYISESSPPAIRGRLIGVFEVFLQFAQIIGFWVNYGVNIHISGTSDTQWRIPFALQFIPGTALCICMFLQPESPRWLLNKGRVEQAKRVLEKLRRLPADHEYMSWEVSTIMTQIEHERALGAQRSFLAKLKEVILPINRTRLLLGIALMFIQNMSGMFPAAIETSRRFTNSSQASMPSTTSLHLSFLPLASAEPVLAFWPLVCSASSKPVVPHST